MPVEKTKPDTNDQQFTDLLKGKVVASIIMDRYAGAVRFTDGTAIAFECRGDANVHLIAEASVDNGRYDGSNILLTGQST